MRLGQLCTFIKHLSQKATSFVYYSLSVTHKGIGHLLLFDISELSSGLSFAQMVGFSLVHGSLGFLGCES